MQVFIPALRSEPAVICLPAPPVSPAPAPYTGGYDYAYSGSYPGPYEGAEEGCYDYRVIGDACPLPPRSELALAQAGPSVCVVTCHNYARFLPECLDSILAQSLKFDAVIVVDDASTDHTADVCSRYASRGVKTLRGEWHDFTSARLAGLYALPRPRFVTFVDADNYLSAEFHALLRKAMVNPSVGVAYSTIASIDSAGRPLRQNATPFDARRLRRDNYADACALIRIEAFEQAGGWQPHDGLTDWLLWLKITRNGWRMQLVEDAHLFYRRHGQNMNVTRKENGRDLAAKVDIVRQGMIVTIVTLFCGRTDTLERVATALRNLRWNKENLRLVAIDNSRDAVFRLKLREALAKIGFPATIIRDDSEAVPGATAKALADDARMRQAKAYALSAHLAKLYARARAEMPAGTDFVWCWEDDIEPPLDALEHLVTGFRLEPRAGVVCGVVRSRFRGLEMIAWKGTWPDLFKPDAHKHHVVAAPAAGVFTPILASGFMCTMFRREVWDAIAFRPAPLWNGCYPYYDWAAAMEVQRGGYLWLLAGSVRCKHWQRDGTALDAATAPAS